MDVWWLKPIESIDTGPLAWAELGLPETTILNASLMTAVYEPTNAPVELEIVVPATRDDVPAPPAI